MHNKKQEFFEKLAAFAQTLEPAISSEAGQWTVKGFIDVFRNIYTISSDTKIVSKILEIHIFPHILKFAEQNGYGIVVAEHQNYYPDVSFVSLFDDRIKFAVDFKTTYKLPEYPGYCNGFTLGSHGEYFINRESKKNIQFPYKDYSGHFCLGIIYSRSQVTIEETRIYPLTELHSITSVIHNLQFFVAEKWKIASDKSGSGNTANIGSISKIEDVLTGRGMFSQLGEDWFDDYWMNYGKISIKPESGNIQKITNLVDFVNYRGGDIGMIVPKTSRKKPDGGNHE